jgi:hypothetical protein
MNFKLQKRLMASKTRKNITSAKKGHPRTTVEAAKFI